MKININTCIICIIVLFSGCVSVSSHSLKIKSAINKKFYIGEDNNNSYSSGLWHLRYESLPDTSIKWEGEKWYSLLFHDPTEFTANSKFILLKREKNVEPIRFMIVKISNDSLIRYYTAKNEKKFEELKKKLGVPDSLSFSKKGT